MNASDKAQIRETLKQLAQALSDADDPANENAATVELDQAKVGRLSRMDALQMQAMAAETQRRRQTQQLRIQAAIGRVDRGEYGLCCECELEISPGRLQADPAAALCIDCANEASV
jgi:DnaK suppressor protein